MALSKIVPLSIASDAVTTVKILDDNVTTAKILDNNVTLAKLGDGTQGDILYYGASGAPTRLGFGTSGDFLKTQGTGANPTWAAAGGGAWTFLQSHTASDSSLIEFVDQFSSSHDIYKVFATNVHVTTDGSSFYSQFRQSSSYLTSNHRYACGGFWDDTQIVCVGSTSAAFMLLSRDATGSAAGETSTWEITICDPLATDNVKSIFWDGYTYNYTPRCQKETGAGMNTTYAAVDGIKFYFSSGNIASGEFALYGLNKS